jgi:hypothetical protein
VSDNPDLDAALLAAAERIRGDPDAVTVYDDDTDTIIWISNPTRLT